MEKGKEWILDQPIVQFRFGQGWFKGKHLKWNNCLFILPKYNQLKIIF